jgi:predicted porin
VGHEVKLLKAMAWRGCACLAIVLVGPPPVLAQAGDSFSVFGRINVAVERVQPSGASSAQMNRLSNYRSILGFRGAEDLGDGLKAIWQIAGSVSLDTGAADLASRDSRVGFAGSWGSLFGGAWTLPYTSSTSSFDPFYPTTAGYMALLGNGSAALADNLSNTTSFDRRQKNVVQYWTPEVAGFSARFAYAFNEEFDVATGAKPWLWSSSASYESRPWTMTIAHEVHLQYQTARSVDTGSKIGATYESGVYRVAVVVERLKYETAKGSLTRDAAFVSASIKTGAQRYQIAYSRALDGHGVQSDVVGSIHAGNHTGATQLTVGADYEFSHRTSLFAYVSQIANQSGASYDFAINPVGAKSAQKPRVLAVGMRHDF